MESAAQSDEKEDVFHFVSYVPINGKIYELDGLQGGPILHGEIPAGSSWLDVVKPVIMKRMESYQNQASGANGDSVGEIKFNLMSLVPSRLDALRREMEVVGSSADLEQRIAAEESVCVLAGVNSV